MTGGSLDGGLVRQVAVAVTKGLAVAGRLDGSGFWSAVSEHSALLLLGEYYVVTGYLIEG